jgi:hypothetical protein
MNVSLMVTPKRREKMKVMPCSHRHILLPLLPVFFLSLAGCMGGLGSTGLLDKESAIVSVSASSISITEGQTITLEAYVNPVLATGTVTFYNGSNVIGTAAISSPGVSMVGIALLATTFSSIGAQSITAHYSGNDFYSASTSAVTSIGVYNDQMASSSVTLQASTTTPQYQTSVTLTAAVSPSSATGTVTFYNGGTNIGSAAVNGGSSSLTTSFAAGGTATLHAVYSGDYNYLSSTSNSLTMNVSGPLVTTTTMKVSTSSIAIGDSVTLTANLTPATTTGTVTFYNGSTAIGTANVNAGVATINTTFASSGNITLKAAFAGNASWEASTSNPVSLFVTGNTPDTVVLQVNPSSLIIGYSATLTANVSPVTATGTVVFYDGTSRIGNCTVADGSCTFVNTFMAAGSQSLTAVYSGDTTYISNTSSAVNLQVSNPGPTPTLTALELSEYSGYSGDAVTLTALVNPPAATGQIDFYDNGNLLESVVLSSGKAAWSQFFAQAGENNITAVYDGDTTYASSTSSPQVLELSNPTTPTCPTDPTLCQIECPTDLTCSFGLSSTLEVGKQRTRLTSPLKLY